MHNRSDLTSAYRNSSPIAASQDTTAFQPCSYHSPAVLLVSHDRHMLELTADRLVLVDNGTATEYSVSIDDYTDMILGKSPPKEKGAKPAHKKDKKAQAAARDEAARLKRAVSDAEADLASLEVVLNAIDAALANPGGQGDYAGLTMGELSQRRVRVVAAQEAAEAKWVAASEALDPVL